MSFSDEWKSERKLIDLLERRFKGTIGKSRGNQQRGPYYEAIRLGFIDEDGHLTSKGKGYLEDRSHH